MTSIARPSACTSGARVMSPCISPLSMGARSIAGSLRAGQPRRTEGSRYARCGRDQDKGLARMVPRVCARTSPDFQPHPRSLCGLAEVVGPECAGTSPKSGAPVPPAMHVAVLAAPGARPCGPWLTIHSSILVTKVLCMRSRLQGLGKPVKKRYPRRSRRWRWGGVWGSAPVGSHGSR